MSLSERIKAQEAELVRLKDHLTEATTALEAAPDEEALLGTVEELTTKVEAQTKTVDALKKAEKALASRAQPVNSPGGVQAPAIAPNLKNFRDPKKGGELLWKHATVAILAHVERKTVDQVLAERYSDDDRVAETFRLTKMLVNKTAVAPAMTTVPAWAGALVREDTRGFIESLTEVSVAARFAALSSNFSFDGFGSIKIPTENPLAATPTEPAWVGEGGVIPLVGFGFGSISMHPYKLAAISTMTQEIVNRSTPAIEAVVENLLRKAYAKVLDNALLNPAITAIANVRPASLTNGVTPVTAGAGDADENVRADVLALLTKLTAAGLGERPVLMANNLNILGARMMVNAMGEFLYAADLGNGNLFSIPVIASGHVPLNRLVMADAAQVATAFGAIDFNVSDVATITEANADGTAPTQAEGTAGAIGTAGTVPGATGGIEVAKDGAAAAHAAGYTARSLWQTYSLGIRMIAETSWGKTNPEAVQFIDAVKWA
jgi:HK97 family phage major capsid protein